MGFAAGVRAGTSLVDSILSEQRQRKLDERATEEFGWKKDDRTRTEQQRREEDTALGAVRSEYDRLYPRQGLVVPASNAIQGATGVRAGTAEGIPTQAVGAPQPAVPVTAGQADAAAAGTATAPTPVVQATPAANAPGREMALERTLGNYALARRDIAGARESMKNAREIGYRDVTNKVMQMKEADVDAQLNGLNTNLSNYPLLFTNKDKNGYEFLKVGPNGERQGTIKLSAPQARQVVLAHELANAGYGTEALNMLNGVSKDLGDTFKAYNDAQYKSTTAGNTALHYGNTEGETRRHNKAQEGVANARLQAEKFQNAKYFSDPDGNSYAIIPQTGRNGVTMQAFKIGGDGSMAPVKEMPKGLKQIGGSGAGSGSDKAVPEAGKIQRRPDGSTYKADGFGGELDVMGVMPDERNGALTKAGIRKEDVANLQWHPQGSYVTFNGNAYKAVGEDNELGQLATDIADFKHHAQKSAEETKLIQNAEANAIASNERRERIRTGKQGLLTPPRHTIETFEYR